MQPIINSSAVNYWSERVKRFEAENAALKAELAEAKLETQKANDIAFQERMERIKAEEMVARCALIDMVINGNAALKAQEPVAIHQWRQTTGFGLWRDASQSEAYSRVDADYEARTLFTAPQPAAVPATRTRLSDDEIFNIGWEVARLDITTVEEWKLQMARAVEDAIYAAPEAQQAQDKDSKLWTT